ncbi:putative transferase, protein kinase RLK-Pelle-RLCK-VIIa-2 family [Helianthus annuus]|nr:putative transferase, protein kinase RLK-Pelle-RLCK-VIIa-2 family [Helianthus annuus]KAJ0652708.1 putative transferase, protein kinase RLK-Pelle-RLCK-VIIa-2 family [Helianthus annuus]KAJ0845003.1 putative transferase, protein kinase RLK-Pelle-RLCK-VIIa-2 family [Helianthus annuus]
MSDHLQLPRLAQLSLWLTNIFKVPGRVATVNYLGLIDHPNFIKLIGYCTDDDHKLLVYKYMERGSLDNYLFRSRFYTGPLAWNLRIKTRFQFHQHLD